MTQLKSLASTFEFANQECGLMSGRIVLGIRNSSKLLRESSLELEKVIENIRASETSREQFNNMEDESSVKINNDKKHRRYHEPKQSP